MISDWKSFAALMARCGPFEERPVLAVALSGGADSMALTLLAHRWAQSLGGRVVALTVDHGLRAESVSEARLIKKWCEDLNIEHHTLSWSPPALSSAIQEQARLARYRLLSGFCTRHHILHLLTAHHQGDQAETLFFRLARGSGLDGLAGMPCQSTAHGIRLLRPLLPLAKSGLKSFLTQAGQLWIEDPSNQSPHYTRNHIRQQLTPDLCQQAGLLAERFTTIRNQLEYKLSSQLTNAISIFPQGYAELNMLSFPQLPIETAISILSHLIQTLSGTTYPPRSEKLARLYAALSAPNPSRRSFGGLLFIPRPRRHRLLICREPAACEAPHPLIPNQPILWDKRFHITTNQPNLHVRALGKDGIVLLPVNITRLEKPALATLPSFWHLDALLAVPHINYNARPALACEARFRPAKALAAEAFSGMNGEGLQTPTT